MQTTLFDLKKTFPIKKGKIKTENYEEFVAKFSKEIPKTTDDCFTPQEVYEEVLAYVREKWQLKAGTPIVRPFFPGGDFVNYTYSDDCVVVDNPPFSIISKIIRFYCENNIKFFLFAPSLSLFSAQDCDITYVIFDKDVIYENGARVRTGFVTNLLSEARVIIEPKPKPKPNTITSARLIKFCRKIDKPFEIKKSDCKPTFGKERALNFGGSFSVTDEVLEKLKELENNG